MRPLGKILIIGAILIASVALARGFYYAPNEESDSGLQALRPDTSSRSAGALPERLIIPKLGIDADIQHVGITKKGNMAAPNNFVDVSWYKFGTVPGELGSAVISGHVDNALGTPAVFYDLQKLSPGDEIQVKDENGRALRFKVVKKEIYPYNLTGPELEGIFNESGRARLNLITCAGTWLPEAKTNDKRLVVFTEMIGD